MSAITTLGVDNLSLRGAGTEYNRFSRFFRTRAEAQAAIDSGDWTPENGVANACLTADEGVLYWDASTSTLENADDATRAYIDTQITDLVGDAPDLLNQLSELADALGDDANFITTVNTKIDTDIATERTRAIGVEDGLALAISEIQDGYDFTGKITAPVTGNVIPFYYADQSAFPSAADSHGAIAHSHADGAMYFAHAGAWHQLSPAVPINDRLADIETTIGVAQGDTDLGTFTGTIIGDNVAVKAALQALETALQLETSRAVTAEGELDTDVADIVSVMGVAENDQSMGVMAAGSDLTDNRNIKQLLEDLGAAAKRLRDGLGVAQGDSDMGTFTGTTISDNASIKTCLQDLETALEADPTTQTAVDAVQADVDQNEADADAAIAALQADVDQNEADADAAIALKADIDSPALTGTPTAPTAGAGTNTTQLATTAFVAAAVAAIVDGAPGALDTLNELAAAMGDDPNLSVTLTNSIAAVQADVNQNELDSDNADAALSARITTLEADPTTATAVAAVQADVDQNEADADTAIAALDSRITPLEADPTTATAVAAVQADVDQNEADSDAAEAALSGRLDVLEVDPTTATAVAAVQADVDQNEADADAAIAALQADVDQNEADADAAIAANEVHIDNLVSLTGLAKDATDLGTFSGTTIADARDIKLALQDLETSLENKANISFVQNEIADVIDGAPGALNTLNELSAALGDDSNFASTVTGLIAANEVHIDNAVTLTGVAKDSTDLGTFTGSTIADSVTIKAALQSLETKVEAVQTDVDGNEADTDAADAALSGRLDVLEADPTTATAVAAVQADVDQNEADADAAIALKADLAGAAFTGNISTTGDLDVAGNVQIDNDGGYYLHFDRNTATQLDIATGNIPSGGNLNIKNSNGTDARVVVYSDLFWVRNLGGSNGNGTAQFDGDVTFGGSITINGTTVTATGAELNFVDGVTSNIQTQLDAIQADVDQNESDADTAIAAVQADVDQNEADADAAIALKADIASPTFTGTPAAPTAASGTNTTQIATTAFVTGAVSDLIDGAPGALDTLNELAAALNDDTSAATNLTTLINANETHIDNLATLTGLAKDSQNLGTFTGATIADDVTIKVALQALETKVEAVQADVDTNESDADTAIAAVQADVDQNEADADAAIAAVLAGTSIPGPYNNDADAATGGVAVGSIYKNSNGTIHWRVS